MPPEGVVSNRVVGLVAEPVGQGPVLSLLLRQPLFDQQAFLGSHYSNIILIFRIKYLHCINHYFCHIKYAGHCAWLCSEFAVFHNQSNSFYNMEHKLSKSKANISKQFANEYSYLNNPRGSHDNLNNLSVDLSKIQNKNRVLPAIATERRTAIKEIAAKLSLLKSKIKER